MISPYGVDTLGSKPLHYIPPHVLAIHVFVIAAPGSSIYYGGILLCNR